MENLIQYRLDNGMNVLLLPSQSAPVVACNVWVGVGSADETPEEAGLAHVHEHMLFKGTETRGVGQIAREVEAAGGHINAFTSFDQTCYYVVMSSRFMDAGLDILSDAIRRSSFEAEELGRELEVIQEEIKRGLDNPSRMASLKLFEIAFEEHPYRLPVIGTSESVDSFERQNVLDFFHKHYVPSNMTVVLAGDFDAETARERVEHFFGDFEGHTHESPARAVEPEQGELRCAVIPDAAQDTHLRVGFHIPNAMSDDIPALELLGCVMGQGEASRLYQSIQREKELVNGIYSGSYIPRDPGVFIVSADYQLVEEGSEEPGATTHDEVISAIMSEVFAFCETEIGEADLQRARTIIESQAIYSKQTVEGLAMKLGQYQMVTGDPLFEDKYYAKLAEVTAADVLDVARKYLRPENCSVVVSHPEQVEAIAEESVKQLVQACFDARAAIDAPEGQGVDISSKPVGQAQGDWSEDEDGFTVIELDGGPTLIVQENHAVEIFAVRALVMGGLRLETAATNGVSASLSDLITRGTPSDDAVSFSRKIESMASSISGITGRNTFGMAVTGLSKFFDPCMRLFAECLFEATIPEDELERTKRLQLQEILSSNEQLGAVNFKSFAGAFFGDYPYGMSATGSVESVSALTPELVREQLGRLVRPDELVIAIVGNVDAAHCAALFEELFSDRSARGERLPEPPAPAPRTEPALVTADLDKNQAHIIVGFDAPVIGSQDRYALEVLHAVLSGQGGRLFYELRDKQSLAYSVYASMLLGMDASTFMINIGTSPEKIEQALRGMVEQVRKLKEEPPSAEEIANAKRYLIGNHDIGLQRNSSRAMSIALDHLYGLGFKRAFDYGDNIEQVTLEQLDALVERYLDISRMVISVTKPESVSIDAGILSELVG